MPDRLLSIMSDNTSTTTTTNAPTPEPALGPVLGPATPLPPPERWRQGLARERCGTCERAIGQTGAVCVQDCRPGHVFHKACHDYVKRFFGGGGCPACSVELRAFPAGDRRDEEFFHRATKQHWEMTQELIEHPLDFGDCARTHLVLGKRATFVDAISSSAMGIQAESADSGNSALLLSPREVLASIRSRAADDPRRLLTRSELVSHLQPVFLSDEALLSDRNAIETDAVALLGLQGSLASSSGVTNALPGYTGSGRRGTGVMSKLRGIVLTAFDVEEDAAATEEAVLNSSSTTLLAGHLKGDGKRATGVLRLLIHKHASAREIFAGGFTPEDLINDGVTLAWLLREGYSLDDLLVLRYDWDTLVLSGLNPAILRGFKGSLLPVVGLCLYLEVGLLDVLEGICNNEVCNLTQCGFSYEELRLLFEVTRQGQDQQQDASQELTPASLLTQWFNMSREDLAAFRWRLKEWHAAGLGLDMIKGLGIDEEYACFQLGWAPLDFAGCYRVPITELVPVQQAPQPLPAPVPVRQQPVPQQMLQQQQPPPQQTYAPRPVLQPEPSYRERGPPPQQLMAPRPMPGASGAPTPGRRVTFATQQQQQQGPGMGLGAMAHASAEHMQQQPLPARPMRTSAPSFTSFRAGPPGSLS